MMRIKRKNYLVFYTFNNSLMPSCMKVKARTEDKAIMQCFKRLKRLKKSRNHKKFYIAKLEVIE